MNDSCPINYGDCSHCCNNEGGVCQYDYDKESDEDGNE